uniref:HAT C-terminal dimerisation domain-containing protein n=1 Tax=Sinocyclocheilus grahami TaxID=75366 RepID=A0A672S8E9_SINGR
MLVNTLTNPTIDTFQRQTLQVSVYSGSSSRQLAINQAIIYDLIIGCCLPLSIVENQHFRHFLHTIDERYTPIARSTIAFKQIPQLVTRVKECLKSSLADQKFVSVTADIWSDRTLRSYLGVTAHVCNSTANEYTLKSFLLDCRRFKGCHNADNIVAAFDEILEEYNINDKVEFIITDNASNMKKAFKFVMAEDHSDDSEDEEDMVGEPLDRNFTLGSRQRLSCFAHSLQLVVGDGLKEVKCLSQAMSKVSKLATLLHSGTIFKDKFEAVFGNGKSIPVATVTRWNSTFKQIKAITELDHTNLTEMCSPDFKNVVITTRGWAQLREFCFILGHFAEATELTEGEKIITISMVVPTVLDLNTHLILMDSPKSLCRPLIRALRESLQQRFSGIFIALHMAEPEDHSFDAPFNQRGLCCSRSLDSLLGMEKKIAKKRLGFGSVPRSRMDSEDLDYSALKKLFHFIIMLRFWCIL